MKSSLSKADLRSYDLIVLNTSGGKDSQVMLEVAAEAASKAGVLDRCIAIHADMGDRVEWDGVPALAQKQAVDYVGVPFYRVTKIGTPASREGKYVKIGHVYGDWLEHVRLRRKWPSHFNPWCRSDWKRGPIQKCIRELLEEDGGQGYRVLNVMGIRAEESAARRKMPSYTREKKGTRLLTMDEWLPIHSWLETEVWAEIKAAKVPHHKCYDLGMPRCSCIFCVEAGKDDLAIGARVRPDLFELYQSIEDEIGQPFQLKHWLADRLK